jgi:hypothetical protein
MQAEPDGERVFDEGSWHEADAELEDEPDVDPDAELEDEPMTEPEPASQPEDEPAAEPEPAAAATAAVAAPPDGVPPDQPNWDRRNKRYVLWHSKAGRWLTHTEAGWAPFERATGADASPEE